MDNLYNRVARRRRPGQCGFTLIELLVVIAVLAILAFIVIFNVVGVANRGNSSACATDVKSLQSAVDSYINDHPPAGTTTPAAVATLNDPDATWTPLVVPYYLHTWPHVSECKTLSMGITYANGTDNTNGYTVVGQ